MVYCDEHLALTSIHHRVVLGREERREERRGEKREERGEEGKREEKGKREGEGRRGGEKRRGEEEGRRKGERRKGGEKRGGGKRERGNTSFNNDITRLSFNGKYIYHMSMFHSPSRQFAVGIGPA